MKKVLAIALFLIFCLFSTVYAADNCTETENKVIRGGKTYKQIVLSCTAAANGSITDQSISRDVTGMYLFMVTICAGSTGPTDNSDFYLRRVNDNTKPEYDNDIIGGAGVNMVDNASDNTFKPLVNGVESPVMIYQQPYIDVDNNVVNSATFTIFLDFVQ